MTQLYNGNEVVTLYPEETWIDDDGNTMLRPSSEGVETRAMIRIMTQSGTSSRREEQMDEGYFTEQVYWIRFPRSSPGDQLVKQGRVGQASVVEWNGEKWFLFGQPQWYNGSSRTRRYQFHMRRN